ncbi:hypothetical protein [Sabulibacter ruber]|uniref:hypothetical protein n=1 Tax=Sabulibacter ruber TaxID=2811901 RepID=UPI001A967B7F|nr:hypothetical protein [Sabulibacter ruber]
MRSKNLTFCCLLLSIVILCLYGCGSKEQKRPKLNKVQNITFMVIGRADSATQQNKGYGIARYIYLDLEHNKVSAYRKALDTATFLPFNRYTLDSTFTDLEKHPALQKLLQQDTTLIGRGLAARYTNDNVEEPLDFRFNEYFYLIRTKVDSSEKLYLFNKRDFTPALDSTLNFFLDITTRERMKPTSNKMNEDSILLPVLSLPKYSFTPNLPEHP